MTQKLFAGIAEVEITPPVGTCMCGSLKPRASEGAETALMVKTIVLESGGTKLAYTILDIAFLPREIGDLCIAAASSRSGIPTDHIIFSCTHTHSGPYTANNFPHTDCPDGINHEWLKSLPQRFADCVAAANQDLSPAASERP
ncbi:MAG: hypothetical protein ACYTGH_22290 [Planctomycetota bacterium]|jgi:hypothetical protein